MAKKVILGTDIARDAFKTKINDNFTELYNKDVALEGQINTSLATELYTITTGFAAGWSGTLIYGITKNDILILSIPQMTKDSDILGTEDVFTLPVGFRPKSVFSAVKTEITGVDISDNNIQDSNVQIQLVYNGTLRFRNTGLVTSNVRRVSGASLFTIL